MRERVRVVLRAVRATRAGAVYGDADGTVRTRWIRARTALFTVSRCAACMACGVWFIHIGPDHMCGASSHRIHGAVQASLRPVRCPDLAGPQYTRAQRTRTMQQPRRSV